jgi:hypothetical protein
MIRVFLRGAARLSAGGFLIGPSVSHHPEHEISFVPGRAR